MKESILISPLAAILVVALTYILFLFFGAALVILFGYAVAIMFAELPFIVVPLGYMVYKRVDVGSYIALETKPRNILLGVALGAFLFFFNLVVSAVLVSIFGVSEAVEESNRLILSMSGSPEGLISVIVALSLAGVCEEFAFRGFLQSAIHSKYPSVVAILVSSLAFGLIHFDPQAVYTIAGFLIGLILGYIYDRWRSYAVSAVTHATLNLIVLTAILLIP